ncbi:MAG: A/G-specific adenine glycosylase [Schaedlerella sp.]|nr:A/G-specific adenine glycosylase [Schaedlerella sp.]
MKYERIIKGSFIERPNRFLAYAELMETKETIHVKNTGRCAELLKPGASIYVQESDNPSRKTKWDLIAAEKNGRIINMDSQIPNKVVQEWVEAGNFQENIRLVKPEITYGNSRFDLYIETDEKKIFIEIKGVTLEEKGVVRFPDAPSERAVKHVEELIKAIKEGYEAYVFFVIQMKGVRYFTPNIDTQPEFAQVLKKAKKAGVQILAYDCEVTTDSIKLSEAVPVVLEQPLLKETVEPLTEWYRENKRDLPWRHDVSAYKVWVSEIMLQQTRVEAVKPYYERFLNTFPTIEELAQAPEDLLLKMWEGLGYYNRVRNMQKAAQQIIEVHGGCFPQEYEKILALKGIGNYTAGAISSFAFGIPKPAVDGNVLRVVSRVLASSEDIMKASVRTKIENALEEVIPKEQASDFNQGLIELGAIVCVPNGEPKCEICPLQNLCLAKEQEIQMELPVKSKAKARRIEKRTVFIFKDGQSVAINKRPDKGLLAGLYEFPNLEGHLTRKEVIEYGKKIGLTPIRVKKLEKAKHIFSHVEWHMTAYEILVDELEKNCTENFIFANKDEIEKKYSIPSAFVVYLRGVKGE